MVDVVQSSTLMQREHARMVQEDWSNVWPHQDHHHTTSNGLPFQQRQARRCPRLTTRHGVHMPDLRVCAHAHVPAFRMWALTFDHEASVVMAYLLHGPLLSRACGFPRPPSLSDGLPAASATSSMATPTRSSATSSVSTCASSWCPVPASLPAAARRQSQSGARRRCSSPTRLRLTCMCVCARMT